MMTAWRVEFESGEAVWICGKANIEDAIRTAKLQAWEATGIMLEVAKAEKVVPK